MLCFQISLEVLTILPCQDSGGVKVEPNTDTPYSSLQTQAIQFVSSALLFDALWNCDDLGPNFTTGNLNLNHFDL